MKRKDLTGQKFGHLTVIEMLYRYNGDRHTYANERDFANVVSDAGVIIKKRHIKILTVHGCGIANVLFVEKNLLHCQQK